MVDQTVVPDETPAPAPPAPSPRRSRAELAAELFGKEFHGKVEEAAPEEEPKPDDTKKGEEPPIEEPTEGEKPEIGEPEKGEAAPEEADETPIVTLSELVEHYELDPDWANTLKVPVQVDGTPTEATISDLVKSYQLTQAAEHRLEAAKSIAQKESETWAAKQQKLEGEFQVLAELIKHEEAILEGQVRAIDPKLRDEDPAEWAARKAEFDERRAHINAIKNETVSKYKALDTQRAAETEALKRNYLQEEARVLMEALPEWKDPKQAETEKAQLQGYLVHACKFSPDEVNQVYDHRMVVIARKAMLYDQSRGQVDTAKKRVAKVPKVMKPGAPKPKEQIATERLAALKARLDKTGSPEDAFAYRMAKRGART